jgi:hypothetical protein
MRGRCRYVTVNRDTLNATKVEGITLAHKVDGM